MFAPTFPAWRQMNSKDGLRRSGVFSLQRAFLYMISSGIHDLSEW